MGIKVEKTKFLAYVLLGFFNGIAAVMISSRLWIASAEMRPNYEFDVITVVVIGGCALSGGKGNILNTMAAAVFFCNDIKYNKSVQRGSLYAVYYSGDAFGDGFFHSQN